MEENLNQSLDFLYLDKEEKIIELQENRIRLSKLIHDHQYIDKFRFQIVSEMNKIEINFSKLSLYLKNDINN